VLIANELKEFLQGLLKAMLALQELQCCCIAINLPSL